MPHGRPSYLPPKEESSGTYYEIDAINFLVDNRLSVGNNESQVRGTWLTLLAHVFPPLEDYMLSAEADAGGGRLDIVVSEVILQGRREESVFFVVECKNPRYEGSPTSWQTASEQLFGYLEAVGSHERLSPGTIKLGAVSIGRSVQFMKYTHGEGELETLHHEVLRLDRQYQTIQDWLDYVKDRP